MILHLIAVILPTFVEAHRILAIFPTPSFSHHAFFQPIVCELARRGHNVTLVTPLRWHCDVEVDNRISQIEVSGIKEVWRRYFNANTTRLNPISYTLNALDACLEMQILLFDHPEVRRLRSEREERFDAVLVEYLGMSLIYMFGVEFQAPLIGLTSFDEVNHRNMGNDWHPINFPHNSIKIEPSSASIFDRIYAVGGKFMETVVFGELWNFWQDRLIDRYFGTRYPRSSEISGTLDLLLVDAPPALGFTRPILPNTVQLGFVHIRDPRPLPEDIQSFLDGSTNGVVYFSLGTNVESKDLGLDNIQMFLEVFRELKLEVLWKYEEGDLPVQRPDNVKVLPWAPQQDILRHPKVRLFITQGGQQSLEEAVYCGVPVLAIPFFGDQHINARRARNLGIGRAVRLQDLDANLLREEIREIIENSTYRENSRRIGDVMRDTPMTPLDTAVWWIEYAIRHNGTKHWSYQFRGISFWRLYMLDVWLSLLLVLASVSWLVKATCRCSRRSTTKEKVKTK